MTRKIKYGHLKKKVCVKYFQHIKGKRFSASRAINFDKYYSVHKSQKRDGVKKKTIEVYGGRGFDAIQSIFIGSFPFVSMKTKPASLRICIGSVK